MSSVSCYKEALSYLKETGVHLANGPSNQSAITFVEDLYALGASRVEVALYDSPHDDEEYYFQDEIFIYFSDDMVHTDVVIAVASIRPDEISYESNGGIRLWWD